MWQYRAALLNVHDGDTITVLADTGFDQRAEVDLRLAQVTAPELTQPGGVECREYVLAWLGELSRLKWPLLVQTEPNTALVPTERRSFTRWIAEVHDIAVGRHLNADVRGFLAGHPEWGPGS